MSLKTHRAEALMHYICRYSSSTVVFMWKSGEHDVSSGVVLLTSRTTRSDTNSPRVALNMNLINTRCHLFYA
ncbi:hypothetical protein TNCV_1045241 [Trichonephila clavipes]|nr:hypothetical protein TNCV_1045241 [Trichonephila clavipes]